MPAAPRTVRLAGGSLKPGFGLNEAVLLLEGVFLPLFQFSCRLFRLDLRRKIPTLNFAKDGGWPTLSNVLTPGCPAPVAFFATGRGC